MCSALFHGEAFPGRRSMEALSGAVLALIDERAHRGEPEPWLVGRLGAFLLRMGTHECGDEVDDHLPTIAATRHAGQRPASCPHPRPDLRASGPDRRDRGVDIARQRGGVRPSDQTRAVRTPLAEHGPRRGRPGSHRRARRRPATSRRTLPGSWTAREDRHGVSTADNPLPSP